MIGSDVWENYSTYYFCIRKLDFVDFIFLIIFYILEFYSKVAYGSADLFLALYGILQDLPYCLELSRMILMGIYITGANLI